MVDMRDFIGPNEKVMWEGVPDKKVTILESIFNPMLPFALIWGLIDLFIGIGGTMSGAGMFVIPFVMLHAMPVWLYIGGVITASLKWRNISYLVTTGGVYVSSGLFTFNYEMKPWTDISHINVHQGIFDRMSGVGDVVFVCNHYHMSGHSSSGEHGIRINNISDYQQVFKLVRDLQTDVYADTMYPNAKRPDTNPGYNTRYNNPNNMGYANQNNMRYNNTNNNNIRR